MADKTQIAEALAKLDHGNPNHWTDDGLPRTSVVQTLAGDGSIKRTDINAAVPGFVRIDPALNLAPEGDGGTVLNAADAPLDATTEVPLEDEQELSEEEARVLLNQRVRDAEATVAEARLNVSNAHKAETEAHKALDKARKDLQSVFPAISAAENYQQHLQRQRDRAMGRPAPSQVDQAMTRGNSRGWGRPQRQFRLADGSIVVPGQRTARSSKVPEMRAVRAPGA